jgi:hypothetical protein
MKPNISQAHSMTNIVPSAPTALPPRLDGFLNAFAVISHGQFSEGGLQVDFPTSFDRNNLEMIWYSGDSQRSGGFFELVDRQGVATFLGLALGYSADRCETLRQILAAELLAMIQSELSATELELWFNDGGGNATLSIGINPGEQEQWLELFWSVD